MMYYGNSGIGWVGMVLGMILVAVLAAGVIWAITRSTAPTESRDDRTTLGGDNALRVLERRYAAGEIEEEEFQRRRQTLLHSQ